jgi:phosphoribosylanthranilate isomerase
MLHIRPLQSTDSLEQLTALLHRGYARLGAMGLNFTAVDQTVEVTAERIQGSHCLVALWNGELAGTVPRVAVTVNATDDELRALHESGVIDWFQLHGDETPERVRSLTEQGLPVFKALGVRDASMLEAASRFDSPTLLLDAYAPGAYGGSGETMDWALGAEAVKRWPDRQIVLAGGLTPENVADAVRQVHPTAVDVASGVESGPGRKDPEKVRAFIEAVRSA